MIALDIDFGTIFALFSDPRSDENRSPEVSECNPKKEKASGSILHGFWDPTWILWGGVREDRFGRFLHSWSCLGGKMAPGCPKSVSRTDLEAILVDFQWIFHALAAVASCDKARAER